MATRPMITLTRLDGELVRVFVDAIGTIEPRIVGESNGRSKVKVMIFGNYRWFEESVAEVLKLLGEAR